MTARATTSQIRAWATALPEVTEKQHFLFKVPVWQVRGRTFAGMGRDETTAVFCITQESAVAAAAADPEHAAAVRRTDARRSFLGLEVQLAFVPASRVESWVREAWVSHAPKTVVKQLLGKPS
ncbi:MAG: MmcQ/YjbR family DNA-binding protein [Acidimicrobiales bacterium]